MTRASFQEVMMGLSEFGTSRQESFPTLSAGKRDRSTSWSFPLTASGSTPGANGVVKGYGIRTRAKKSRQTGQNWRPLPGLPTAREFSYQKGPIGSRLA